MYANWALLTGIVLAIYTGTSYWIFTDALRLPKMIRLNSGEVYRDMGGTGPFAWFVGCMILWVVAVPSYLVYRGLLIRKYRLRYTTFHKEVTETGLSAYSRRQALINGLYLASVVFFPSVVWGQHSGTSVVFLWQTGSWAGWALFFSGLLVLLALVSERSATGAVRMRMAQTLMPGLPMLLFACIVGTLNVVHLHSVLTLSAAFLVRTGQGGKAWPIFVTYGWVLLFWMFPAVAAVNTATEAFTPGLASLFTRIRAVWQDDERPEEARAK